MALTQDLVIEASIAVKWVVEEESTEEAPMLRRTAKLVAPELMSAECANILWKKCQRDELSKDEAFLAAQLLQAADIDLAPTWLCATLRRWSSFRLRLWFMGNYGAGVHVVIGAITETVIGVNFPDFFCAR